MNASENKLNVNTFYGRFKARLSRGQQLIALVGWIWLVTSTFILYTQDTAFQIPKEWIVYLLPAVAVGVLVIGYIEDKGNLMSKELGYITSRNAYFVKMSEDIEEIKERLK